MAKQNLMDTLRKYMGIEIVQGELICPSPVTNYKDPRLPAEYTKIMEANGLQQVTPIQVFSSFLFVILLNYLFLVSALACSTYRSECHRDFTDGEREDSRLSCTRRVIYSFARSCKAPRKANCTRYCAYP